MTSFAADDSQHDPAPKKRQKSTKNTSSRKKKLFNRNLSGHNTRSVFRHFGFHFRQYFSGCVAVDILPRKTKKTAKNKCFDFQKIPAFHTMLMIMNEPRGRRRRLTNTRRPMTADCAAHDPSCGPLFGPLVIADNGHRNKKCQVMGPHWRNSRSDDNNLSENRTSYF